ncbi:ferredoxin--NADP reductase [Sutterella sp.]|uniref:ferredoxin--NADP reductase n=1 Tax=Sutterella sp. TaxID=1981025 RepID=UPI0026E073CA|nr:ferredoxin--NADP reductase [Sutterella sp.]MDO5531645.1 ferredoxin--NADP reductase [Sutterella sp.]
MQTIALISRRQVAPTLFVLRFERPEGFTFEPGQFARLGLEGAPGEEPVIRGYSIASAPEENVLEFFITEVKDGKLSPRICALNPGDRVILDGPAQGALTPSRIPGGETLWLLATGSGLSPFASIIRSGKVWEAWQDLVLVISVRKIEEAALARELVLAMPSERRPKLIITTTREEDPARQGNLSGRIPALIASGDLEKAAGREITAEKSRLMLCGNPGFIAETRAELKKRSIVSPRFGKPGQLVVENFW